MSVNPQIFKDDKEQKTPQLISKKKTYKIK